MRVVGLWSVTNSAKPEKKTLNDEDDNDAGDERGKVTYLFLLCLVTKTERPRSFENLRRNPPEVRVISGQKSSTKIIYIVLQTSVRLFEISSDKNSVVATPNVEKEYWTSYETLNSTGEMKLMMRFATCLHKFSELWNLFSLVPRENCFRCSVSGILFIY